MEKFEELVNEAIALGAYRSQVISTDDIKTDVAFRDMCKANLCGKYGRCYTCPPDIGDINDLVFKLKSYKYALVYQTVGELEDSFDVEGMQDAAKKHASVVKQLLKDHPDNTLHLGAGGCPHCERCAKITNEPCRHPDIAISSLEAHGVNVSELAKVSGMKYINGQNTVTYFGAMLFNEI